jgi:hypothetical protein
VQYWKVFLKGFELRMVQELHSDMFRAERVLVEVRGQPIEIWFPDLSADERFPIFQELVLGKLTGTYQWEQVEYTTEYAFHLDNV